MTDREKAEGILQKNAGSLQLMCGKERVYAHHIVIDAMLDFHAQQTEEMPNENECRIIADAAKPFIYDSSVNDIDHELKISWYGVQQIIKEWNEFRSQKKG